MSENNSPETGGPPEPENKTRRRAMAAYRWWDRYDSAQGWYDWLASFLSTKAGTAAAVVTAGAVTTAASVGIYHVVVPPIEAPAEIVAVEPQRLSDTSIMFPVEGQDTQGRRGKFDVVVLTKNFGWVRKSSDELVRDGTVLSGPNVASDIFNEDVRASFSKANAIIAAGVASQEGDPAAETERAGKRARRSAEWLAPAIDPSVPIWTLNLGQYRQPCPECAASGTDWQRPLIVVAVRELAPGANMGEALADGLRGKSNLPSPESYSAYEMTRFR